MVTVVVDGVVTSSYRYTTLEDVTDANGQVAQSTLAHGAMAAWSRFSVPREL